MGRLPRRIFVATLPPSLDHRRRGGDCGSCHRRRSVSLTSDSGRPRRRSSTRPRHDDCRCPPRSGEADGRGGLSLFRRTMTRAEKLPEKPRSSSSFTVEIPRMQRDCRRAPETIIRLSSSFMLPNAIRRRNQASICLIMRQPQPSNSHVGIYHFDICRSSSMLRADYAVVDGRRFVWLFRHRVFAVRRSTNRMSLLFCACVICAVVLKKLTRRRNG